jgi:Glycosyltransferase 61
VFKRIAKKLLISQIQGVSINDIEMMEEELIFPEATFNLPERLDIFGQRHNHFSSYACTIPPFYVRSIKNAKCVIGKEEVFTCNNEVIIEYTAQKANPYIGENRKKLNKPLRINGRIAHLSLSGLENNYYHWLTECLNRYYLLEKSKFKPDLYLLSSDISFQKQYIELLGIDKERILRMDSNTIIQADELIVPSFINNWESINFRGYKSCQKQWLPSWIGNIYQEKIDLKSTDKDKNKIYISRSFADYRRLENEDEVTSLLQNRGYGIYYLENMLVKEQVELFSNASIVLGLHGAGFSNIFFCPQDTKVCELFTENYHDSSFKVLTNALGLEYHYIIGKTCTTEDILPHKENVYIDLRKFKLSLDILEKLK